MTSLLGNPGDPWPLARAVDALVESARRAGRPGMIWAAGLIYPSFGLALGVVGSGIGILERAAGVEFPILADWGVSNLLAPPLQWMPGGIMTQSDPRELLISLALLLALFPLTIAISRMNVGLASISNRKAWDEARIGRRSPALRSAWKAGKGMGASAFGLVLTFPLLFFGATLFLLGPVFILLNLFEFLRPLSNILAFVFLPIGLLLSVYGIVLQVLIQLALHSLAHNDRGTASALNHAWRLVRNNPWSTLRSTLVDGAMQTSILIITLIVRPLFSDVQIGGSNFGDLSSIFLFIPWSIVGVTRACYWSHTYKALGGLTTRAMEPPEQPKAAVSVQSGV